VEKQTSEAEPDSDISDEEELVQKVSLIQFKIIFI